MPTIEHTATYATVVDDLPAAWSFVMDHVDRVGPDPHVVIEPSWEAVTYGDAGRRRFGVSVSGMVPQ